MSNPPLILVVDDEKDLREIMSLKLKSAGFQVAMAKGGIEAVKMAQELIPDLVLMDIQMPDMKGTDAALAIKQNDKSKNVRVVFLSGMGDPWPAITGSKQDVSRELGMEDFIDKTSDLDATLAKIKEILARPA